MACKGRVCPATNHEGSEGELRYSSSPSVTVVWVVNATPWPLCPGERHLVPVAQEAGWASGPVLPRREYLASTGV